MPWFKVDDSFPTHPKVLSISRKDRAAAVGLWTLAGGWCAAQLTDGHLAVHMVGELASSKRYADLLVTARLWERTDSGYVFHDWADWQPTRAQVEADRSAARDRMKRVRSRRSSPEQTANDARTSEGVRLTPSRPDPTRGSTDVEPASGAPSGARPRGTRIPDDFSIDDEMRGFGRQLGFTDERTDAITAAFIDYWRGISGHRGVKLDWPATWRNWIRREAERNPRPVAAAASGRPSWEL